MSLGKLKIDTADRLFSLFIRNRDNYTCVRCKKRDPPPGSMMQNSHYFGRRKESTRYDELNCDTLCFGCHQYWGSSDKEGYRQFKIKQLGQKGFDLLTLRANTPQKKDRKLVEIYYKNVLKGMRLIS